jgi:hypothetical protein
MATKKKSKTQTKSKKAPAKRVKVAKKAVKKTTAKKSAAVPKKTANKKLSPPKAAAKAKASSKKPSRGKTGRGSAKPRGRDQRIETADVEPAGMGARSGGQSGDLEGLSDVATADSESVDELIEEGNAFEAEVVLGVEDALDPDQGEVTTHEVPEDEISDEFDEQ